MKANPILAIFPLDMRDVLTKLNYAPNFFVSLNKNL